MITINNLYYMDISAGKKKFVRNAALFAAGYLANTKVGHVVLTNIEQGIAKYEKNK